MHRSRLSTILIDSPTAEARQSAAFWSAALGVGTRVEPGEEQYTGLVDAVPNMTLAVQSVDDAPRYHFDIETDDVAAEVARLGGLGAVEIAEWAGCHTMRVPGGQLICVIPRHSDPEVFRRLAREWP
jgi:hypothetical protein